VQGWGVGLAQKLLIQYLVTVNIASDMVALQQFFTSQGQQYTSIKAKFDDKEYTGGLPSHARFGQDGQGVGTEASKKVKSKKMVKFVYLVVFQMNSY